MGSLYRRKGSGNWYLKYYVAGRPVRESTGTDKRTVAAKILADREGRAARGEVVMPRADKVRFDEAMADLTQYYEAHGSRDMKEYSYRVAHLERFFRGWKIAAIGAPAITAYIVKRQAAGAAGGTIRRELGTLGKLLRLAYENAKLLRLPVIRKPKEGPAREGFFEREQYEAVARHLPADLQLAAAIAYTFGWRTQSEVLTLERRQLDLEAGTLRLDPGSTKNDDGRVVYITPQVKAMLVEQLERIREVERQTDRIIPYLFPYLSGAKRLGARRRDYRKVWAKACTAAGVPGKYRHDFRRTAVRNMVNLGVPERVAMSVTGHKSRSVFDRYHIVSPADLQEASRKLAGHSLGHTHQPRATLSAASIGIPSTGG